MMNKKVEVNLKLIKKYFENKCTPEEAARVLQWIERSDASSDLEKDFLNAWQKIKIQTGDSAKYSERLEKIHERIEMEEIYQSLNMNTDSPAFRTKDRHPIAPGDFNSQKKLRKVRFIIGAVLLIVLAFAVYLHIAVVPIAQRTEKAQIEKVTSPGQKLTIHLADGSEIILNAGSKVIYMSDFGKKNRDVYLEGEAYFEVSKNPDMPFNVITGSLVTTALGTSFNIDAFPSNDNIEIALVSGRVRVSKTEITGKIDSISLTPGMMAIYSTSNDQLVESTFDFDQVVSWKDGIIYFKDADYKEIESKLESWYGVDITANRMPESKWQFNGKFENETLDNILMALQFGHKFKYEINGKDVKLIFDHETD